MAQAIRGPGPLEPSLLASKAKWRKLKIDICPEEAGEVLK